MSRERNFKLTCVTAFVAAAALSLGGCTSVHSVNADVYESGSDLTQRVKALQRGMSKDEFIEILGKDITKHWVALRNSDINNIKYGSIEIAGSYDDMQKIADELRRSEGFSFRYADVKEHWKLRGLHIKTETTGEDITFWVVFTDGKLEAWKWSGGPVNERDRDSILPADDLVDLIVP